MSFTEVSIDIVENGCRAAIASIEKKRDRLRAEHDAQPWWRRDSWDRRAIGVIHGRQEYTCERLLDLCALARSGGKDCVKVSADDAECFVGYLTPLTPDN